jgi:hypothetical protein
MHLYLIEASLVWTCFLTQYSLEIIHGWHIAFLIIYFHILLLMCVIDPSSGLADACDLT